MLQEGGSLVYEFQRDDFGHEVGGINGAAGPEELAAVEGALEETEDGAGDPQAALGTRNALAVKLIGDSGSISARTDIGIEQHPDVVGSVGDIEGLRGRVVLHSEREITSGPPAGEELGEVVLVDSLAGEPAFKLADVHHKAMEQLAAGRGEINRVLDGDKLAIMLCEEGDTGVLILGITEEAVHAQDDKAIEWAIFGTDGAEELRPSGPLLDGDGGGDAEIAVIADELVVLSGAFLLNERELGIQGIVLLVGAASEISGDFHWGGLRRWQGRRGLPGRVIGRIDQFVNFPGISGPHSGGRQREHGRYCSRASLRDMGCLLYWSELHEARW
ncbi:MAG TPA: hypothetical protein VMX94_11950 [Armatimonadota bacterium]|nr:hypothetical protein [Armatimonadota bacterium]